MANPRKFREKIALHAQKQAEGTAAFDQIMREVNIAVPPKGAPGVHPPLPSQPVLISQSHQQAAHRGCGGSLPNMNQMAGYPAGQAHFLHQGPYRPLAGCPVAPYGVGGDQRGSGVGPYRSPRASEHRRDTSPYRAVGYLCPPADTSWRRTHSDSSLHQGGEPPPPAGGGPQLPRHTAVTQQRDVATGCVPHQAPCAAPGSGLVAAGHWAPFGAKTGVASGPPTDQRVPGTYSYNTPTHPAGGDQPDGPSINGSGSLPDLSSLNFPPPLPQGIDGDDPTTRLYCQPAAGLSPSQRAAAAGGMLVTVPPPGHQPHMPLPAGQGSLAVPLLRVSANYLHTCKGVAVENQSQSIAGNHNQGQYANQTQHQQHQQRHQSQQQQDRQKPQQSQQQDQKQQRQSEHRYQQQHQEQERQQHPPPLSMSPDFRRDSMTAYRSPQRSPLSVSPLPGFQSGYRSPSPLDGLHSAPASPAGPPSPLPGLSNNDFFISPQTQQMQEQFEQFNVGMSPGAVSTASSSSSVLSSGGPPPPATPQTPTNTNVTHTIPEITLSDFSSFPSSPPLQVPQIRQDLRDAGLLLHGNTSHFREPEPLGELDLEGLQILTNPHGEVIDPSAEQWFRMESLGQ